MKRVISIAGFLVVVSSLVGCASTQQQHVVYVGGLPVYCATTPAQGDGDCDPQSQADAPQPPPDSVNYRIEVPSRAPEPFDPGVVPNFKY